MGNHTAAKANNVYIISPTVNVSTVDFISQVPIKAMASVSHNVGDDPMYRAPVNLVKIGTKAETMEIVTKMDVSYNNDLFTRERLVSSTFRCFKISTDERESGTVVIQYAPTGINITDGKPLNTDLHRPARTKKKIYIP